jgi:hypothetical protein
MEITGLHLALLGVTDRAAYAKPCMLQGYRKTNAPPYPPHARYLYFLPMTSVSPTNIHLSSSMLATFLARLDFSATLTSASTASLSQCAFFCPYSSIIWFSCSTHI